MNKKKTIRKAIVIGACLLVSGGITSLLIAANRKEATHYCQRIDIQVKGSSEKLFISQSDIQAQLRKAANGTIINKRIETINVSMLENALEKHQWIRDAELYFDTRDVLHVVVSERAPIARVFAETGTSFYIDSAGKRMPLLPDVSVRVPVVTGFPAAKVLHKADSTVVKEVSSIAQFITTHPFWNAQIAQIDITPAGTFELLPVVGNHVIRIGRAENIDEKLSNLLLFYKQVLRKTGVDKYAVVDVQYKDQVVGSHERTISKIDSVQLQRNIQELMRKAKRQAEADSLAVVEEMAELEAAAKDSLAKATNVTPKLPAENPKPVAPKQKIQPRRKPVSNTTTKPANQNPKPKAVMTAKRN